MALKALERRLKFLAASYRRHGIAHVVEVFRQALIRRRYRRVRYRTVGPAEFMQSFRWFSSEASFFDDYRSHFPITLRPRPDRLVLADSALRDAELIATGRFPMLGLCIAEAGGTFDWHRDYLSGRQWPRLRFEELNVLATDGSDVKYVWEPSRLYWISWLGQAWRCSGDERHARQLMDLLDDWHRSNPLNFGVNWAMPMEVAIRAFWLAIAMELFHDADSIDREWWTRHLIHIHEHGHYLEHNLEYFPNLTNHYLSNCLGLIAVGFALIATDDGRRWFEQGRRRLIEELEHQVLSDGVHYERSIGYHRLVVEFFLLGMLLCERVGEPLPEPACAKIERMCAFIDDYTAPDGSAPQLGDSDDGVMLRLRSDQNLYDHRDTLGLAAALFDRPEWATEPLSEHVAGAHLLGLTPVVCVDIQRERRSALYAEGGFACLRSDSLFVFADAGPIGLHGNNDTLSFTLHGESETFIVDPGTYCYTRDAARRNALRSSLRHNGPVFDGRELAVFDGLWRVERDDLGAQITHWNSDLEATTLQAHHTAYRTSDTGRVLTERRFELRGDTLSITDRIEAAVAGTYSMRLVIPGECTVLCFDDSRAEIHAPSGRGIRLSTPLVPDVRLSWYAPSYGVAAPATEITFQAAAATSHCYTYRFTYITKPSVA